MTNPNTTSTNNFESIRIGIASPSKIRSESFGEVLKAETINYRSLKPEKDGLFCERIFGPVKDFECACGKYKRVRHRGVTCEICGVDVTYSKVRRERMGHIELAAPVSHIWYFKGVSSKLSHFLDIAPKNLEKVLYLASNIVTYVDQEGREKDQEDLKAKVEEEISLLEEEKQEAVLEIEQQRDRRIQWLKNGDEEDFDGTDYLWSEKIERNKLSEEEKQEIQEQIYKDNKVDIEDTIGYIDESISQLEGAWEMFLHSEAKDLVEDDATFREMIHRFGSDTGWGHYITGGMGAEAIKELLQSTNIKQEIDFVQELLDSGKGGQVQKTKLQKRLSILHAFSESGNKPEWMILEALPVLPPELRPMVELDGGRFATSDLNELYRKVINRNNRLKKLLELGAPEVVVANEKRMLQESVDALFDNGRRGAPVTSTGSTKRPLKSLADMLKGKGGRFRQNLLGKRVDYSGRSVIVAGPELSLHQCGLPKLMARELFKPFVMNKLVERRIAEKITAKHLVEEGTDPVVWDILEEVIKEHPVLLNRAPTLHRLGIQAFEPVLVEGKAIQVHPLVCTAFNADFDGDQMAVHVPLTLEAQAEARLLMLASKNILSPAHGGPITVPSQDMILGLYYLTMGDSEQQLGQQNLPALSGKEIRRKVDSRVLSLHSGVKYVSNRSFPVNTTAGRVIFYERIIEALSQVVKEEQVYKVNFQNKPLSKKDINNLVNRLVELYGPEALPPVLDEIKDLGFHYATKAGVTISKNDVTIPKDKPEILAKAEQQVALVEEQYDMGEISEIEKRNNIIEIWTKTTQDVSNAMEKSFDRSNSIWMMAESGARGSIRQVSQLAGMRGLMANPKGEIIESPIRSNFLEGLNLFEYFISTHGARKGLADTALRTADSGYLTRRLVDVSQDIVVREHDCGSKKEALMDVYQDGMINPALLGRASSRELVTASGRIVVSRNELLTKDTIEDIVDSIESTQIAVRTPLGCRTEKGICQSCYGLFAASGKITDIGDAVGIIAAQSIGEPGTQLTMRTFHTGGVAGDDITQGLPRVDEIFEARSPKGLAVNTDIEGTISIIETNSQETIVEVKNEHENVQINVPRRLRVLVEDGDQVQAGQALTEGSLDPHKLLENHGPDKVAQYMVEEVQKVYQSQGVDINNKHVEVIARQMLRRAKVLDAGDTDLLIGSLVEVSKLEDLKEEMEQKELTPPHWKYQLLGVSKASLSTDSFLSAASFQETTRVLTDAAVEGKIDYLEGLKENVIIGKLIPAATGLKKYRKPKLELEGELLAQETIKKISKTEEFDSEIQTPKPRLEQILAEEKKA